jgi:TonB-linked SusC/RagA family outer membrane protein
MELLQYCKSRPKRGLFYQKLLLIMRLTAVLLCVTALHVAAATFSQKVTIKGKNLSLAQVFEEIKQQTKFDFVYDPRLLQKASKVTLSVKDQPVTSVLNLCLGNQPLAYEIRYQTIIIKEKPGVKLQEATPQPGEVDARKGETISAAAQLDVQGRVVNEKGEPLEGASVVVKGASSGTQTGADGSFHLSVARAGVVIVVSYAGYTTKEITVENNKPLSIILQPAVNKLDEAMVIAYGSTSRRLNTGAISVVKGESIAETPVQSFEGALNGRATGVNMVANSGVVNQAPVFRIRGTNSLSLSSYPLVVIDGVAVFTDDINVGGNASNNPLASINPADIESVDIAKDAAATSIYGSRAANGVVFITTKKGKPGKARVVYDAFWSQSKAARLAELLNGDQYLEIKNEGLVNAGTYNATSNYYGNSIGPDGKIVRTNWYDYIFRKGMSQNHTVSVSGANQSTKYYLSVGYARQEGILKGNDYTRKSVTYNVEHKVTKWLTIGSKTNFTNDLTSAILSTGNGVSSSASNSVAYRLALVAAPIVGPYNKDGSFNATGLNLGLMDNQGHLTSTTRMGYTNPVITLAYNQDNTGNNTIQSNVYGQLNPVSWITLKTVYGVDNIYSRTERYFDPRTNEGTSANGSAYGISATRENWVWTNTATVDRQLGQHSFNLLLGQETQKRTGDQFGLNRTGQSDPFYSNIQGGFNTVVISNTANAVYYQYLTSIFSRLQYNYGRTYFLSANIRQDKASMLGANNKAGTFWAFSGGYEIANEDFWKDSRLDKLFSSFKIRGSYGKVGNLAGIDDYASLSTYSANLYGGLPGLYYSAAGNADLRWETSKKTDVGISFGLLKDRITGDISYYNNNIDGLIFNVPTPASAGLPGSTLNSVLTNVGKMYNRGWEIALSGTPVQGNRFSWNTTFNISFNKNQVTALTPTVKNLVTTLGGSSDLVSISLPGYSVGMIYAIRTAGVDPATGRRIFLNGAGQKVLFEQAPAAGHYQWEYADGTKANAVTTSGDAVVYKNTNPKIYGGFINSFHYGGFDLDALITYQFGGNMYFGTQGTLMDARFPNNSTKILARWKKAGDITDVPKVEDGDYTSWGYSLPITANVYSSNFVRLKNLTLSYNIPAGLYQKIQISSIRVFISGQNLALITRYPGADPEVTTTGNATAGQGFDRNMMPNARIFTAGVKVGF